jgi:hypothetical protein
MKSVRHAVMASGLLLIATRLLSETRGRVLNTQA